MKLTNIELQELQSYMEGKTIALIGNGKCILNRPYGKLIDSHDIVIRFNWALETRLDRWPDNVGTKFNVYVFAIRSAGKLRQIINRGVLKDKDFVIRTRHDDSYYLDAKVRKRILYYSGDEFRESISNEFFINKEPSTGAMTVQFLLDCVDFKSISLFGFDFFETSADRPQESNEFKSFFYGTHSKKEEKIFFNHWISEYSGTGKINFYE